MSCGALGATAASALSTRSSSIGGRESHDPQVPCLSPQFAAGICHKLVFLLDRSEKVYQLGNLVFPSTL